MNKAFLFDMDGVLVDSEPIWEKYERKFLPELMGKEIYGRIKNQILGNSISTIYEKARQLGFSMKKNAFLQIYFQYAKIVYQEAILTPNIEMLIEKLTINDWKIGLVSVSRKESIDIVLKKLKNNPFRFVLSLDSRGIKPKPSPDGYSVAMNELGVTNKNTYIIEDSQRGVDAAKASGAYTICLVENLPENYLPAGADMYVKTAKELIERIEYLP